MHETPATRHAREILTLFDVPRAAVKRFGLSATFRNVVRQAKEPTMGDLITLTLRHVPAADFLPISMLVEDLNDLRALAQMSTANDD
ncbi:hypothetical protein [Deinococcus pimensis]|uniref:hypothetical protein n=1 Tax=Deinococcus pimensis TaxID=309888 RepID=UPI00047FC2C4|nr:hypothetical protein [Deinococcus pimensis]